MMMNLLGTSRLALAAAVLALAACAAPRPEIRTDYDAATDFSRFATFAFIPRPGEGARSYDTIAERRVVAAVTRELEARGYRKVAENPDLLVNFALASEEVQDIRTVPTTAHWPHWHGWRGGFYHPWPLYTQEIWVDRFERGTLFVDLVDAERRQLVWEGRAIARVTRAAREDPAGAVDNAVREIFARYPFRAGPQR